MQYSKKVMEYFSKPKHAKRMIGFSGKGKVGNPRCGDIMEVFIKVGKNKKGEDFIKEISFLTFGCAAAIASSEAMCRIAKGKTIKEALKITNQDIVNHLNNLPMVKIHCSVLGMEGLHKAIEDYENKKSLNKKNKTK